MRDSGKANIVEVMIMAQSILKGFAKLYPTVRFFKNHEILDEIKPAILELFKDYIENEIKLDQEKINKFQNRPVSIND